MSRVVLITGASSGIGRSIARTLAGSGYVVYGTSRHATHGEKLDNFTLLQLDITDENSVKAAVGQLLSIHQRIDVVINNAGSGFNGPVENISNEEIRAHLELNVIGAWNVCRAVLPGMRSNGKGHIINISSMAGWMGLPYRGLYSASKSALMSMSESLSMEVKKWGIHVSVVSPAEYNTRIAQNRGSAANVSEAYRDDFDRIVTQINKGVEESNNPDEAGVFIDRILQSPHPKMHYKLAPPMVKFSIVLKRILPDRWFEKLVMKNFGMK